MRTGKVFLVDTSVWINVLRPDGQTDVLRDMEQLLSEQRIATAEIVILELMRGVPTHKEFLEMERDMRALPVLICDDESWRIARRLAFDLKTRGVVIPTVDLIIASLAIRYNTTLLHADKHFHLIAQRTVLSEWYREF